MKYAIIDIETTGGNHRTERITEIAIYVHDGKEVVDEYTTLINPEKHIPPFISSLTGITNDMVAKAPKFFEVAKEIVLRTEGAVFVAHNVNFDYSFVRNEFNALGFDYQRKTLDTVKLSRKILPGHESYSLGKLCGDLGIEINGRHRAAGDAIATVQLFEILLRNQEMFNQLADPEAYKLLKGIDQEFHREMVAKLPELDGVYYFYDADKTLIYIGKSKNIKKRVAQHLRNTGTRKAQEMRERIKEIKYTLTGSELIALLLESDEIKKHKPIYNRSQRRTLYSNALFFHYDLYGYLNLKIDKINANLSDSIMVFGNRDEAKETLFALIEKYNLCQKLCGQYKTDGACFNHGIKKCAGACLGEEAVDDYNNRVVQLIEDNSFAKRSFFLVDKGKQDDEKALVYVKSGVYQGFGYVKESDVGEWSKMEAAIQSYNNNRDVQQIIKLYYRKKKYEKLLQL